jgi:hypothetical protein
MFPFQTVDLYPAEFFEHGRKCRVFDDSIDGIRHGIDVPKINFDGMSQNFGYA